MTRLIPAAQELTAQPANAVVRSNGSTRPLPGWLGGWDLNVLSFTHQLGPTDFNIVNAYYLLAETADAWPTMREVADAVGVVLSTVHYRYHELAASGYLPGMGKSGIDELDEMPWRLAQATVLPQEVLLQAPTAPEEPEAPQEPEGGQRIVDKRKALMPAGFQQRSLIAIKTGPTRARKSVTVVAPSLDFDVFG